jgi:DNA-binding IclR family transcriptional regulator
LRYFFWGLEFERGMVERAKEKTYRTTVRLLEMAHTQAQGMG